VLFLTNIGALDCLLEERMAVFSSFEVKYNMQIRHSYNDYCMKVSTILTVLHNIDKAEDCVKPYKVKPWGQTRMRVEK
jgi:hypothetical protein